MKKKKTKIVKMSCGTRRGCIITLMPTFIKKAA